MSTLAKLAQFTRAARTPMAALVAATHDLGTGRTTEQSIHFAFLVFGLYWLFITLLARLITFPAEGKTAIDPPAGVPRTPS